MRKITRARERWVSVDSCCRPCELCPLAVAFPEEVFPGASVARRLFRCLQRELTNLAKYLFHLQAEQSESPRHVLLQTLLLTFNTFKFVRQLRVSQRMAGELTNLPKCLLPTAWKSASRTKCVTPCPGGGIPSWRSRGCLDPKVQREAWVNHELLLYMPSGVVSVVLFLLTPRHRLLQVLPYGAHLCEVIYSQSVNRLKAGTC